MIIQQIIRLFCLKINHKLFFCLIFERFVRVLSFARLQNVFSRECGMDSDRFKLVYSGVVEGTDEEVAKAAIQERFQIQLSTIEKWFGQERAVVKQDLTQDQAWKLQYVLESMGVLVFPVLQTRSNLKLDQMDLVASQDLPASKSTQSANHSLNFGQYQPQGVAEFNARPTTGARASSVASAKRRQPSNKSSVEAKSFKLTHMMAAAVLVMVLSYAGKQLFVGSGIATQSVASLSE